MNNSWGRIRAMLLHSWYHTSHSKETWIDLLWFTAIQFVVFGFISRLFGGGNGELSQALLAGFLLWETVRISQYCITVSVLWEVWSKSFSTLLISPLSMDEWIASQAFSGIIKTAIVIVFLSTISSVFFHFFPLQLGPIFLLYFLILFSFGIAAGIFLTGLIVRYSTDVQSVAWGLIYILQPISAVFYPVSALPIQIRWLAYSSPITYIAESVRNQLKTGQPLWNYILISAAFTIMYLIGSWFFMQRMLKWSKETGALARLGN